MPVGIGKVARIAAPEDLLGRFEDRAAGRLRQREELVDLVVAAGVEGNRHATERGPGVARAGIRGQVGAGPQSENQAVELVERDVVLGIVPGPAEALLIEPSGAGEVRDAQSDQAESLFHAVTLSGGRDNFRLVFRPLDFPKVAPTGACRLIERTTMTRFELQGARALVTGATAGSGPRDDGA